MPTDVAASLRDLATFFTIPKAFTGSTSIAQHNAIESWLQMANVIVIGDEAGTVDAAANLQAIHIADVEKNENGTPLVNSAFDLARRSAKTPYLIYCNCDIILFDDFAEALVELCNMTELKQFVATAQRTTYQVDQRIDFGIPNAVTQLKKEAKRSGTLDSIVCKDLFVFPRECYVDIPSFAVGRGNWDNWMIHNAKQNRLPVISLSDRILTLHQQHDHCHAQTRYSAYVSGSEAKTNQKLAGGRHLVSGSTPDFYLDNQALRPARMKYINGEFWMDFPRFVHLLMNFIGTR